MVTQFTYDQIQQILRDKLNRGQITLVKTVFRTEYAAMYPFKSHEHAKQEFYERKRVIDSIRSDSKYDDLY
jgi:hypothetical protein